MSSTPPLGDQPAAGAKSTASRLGANPMSWIPVDAGSGTSISSNDPPALKNMSVRASSQGRTAKAEKSQPLVAGWSR